MAGFLTRIAARLGGPDGQIRPRPLSLFEPPAAAELTPAAMPAEGPDIAVDITAEADARTAEASVPPAGPGRQRRPTPRRTTRDATGPEQIAGPPPEAIDNPQAARGASIAASRPARAAADLPTAAPATMPDGRPPEVPSRAVRPARTAAPVRSVAADPAVATDPVPRTASRAPTTRHHSAPPLPHPDDRTAAVDAPQDKAAPTPATPPGGILQAPAVARIAAAPLPPSTRTRHGEPEIHVTIGRIEVRAEVASPAGTARPERPSPVMSLDDYLRTRAR